MVTLVGLKPTTLGLEIPCSIHLSYKAMKEGVFRRFYPYFTIDCLKWLRCPLMAPVLDSPSI